MGVVYVAEHLSLGRLVAIKTLNLKAAKEEPNFRKRFLREVRTISALSHPQIAAVYDYGETEDGEPFLVMELVRGETLSDLISTDFLTIPRSLDITRQVTEALSVAHRHGVIHRDRCHPSRH